MAEEIIREGSWICPNCRTKNRGAHEKCTACGAIRGNVPFIYEEAGQQITDEAEKARALGGADWVCPFCGDSSPFDATACKGCSAPRSEGKQREVKNLGGSGAGSGQSVGMSHPAPDRLPDIDISTARPVSPAAAWFFKIGCGGLLLLILSLMGLECMTWSQVVEVSGLAWHRTVEVEELKTVIHEDWSDRMPSGARVLARAEKIRSYRDVLVGQREVEETYTEQEQTGTRRVKTGVQDLGNGRFKEIWSDEPVYRDVQKRRRVVKPVYRQEPVYGTWMTYEADEWVKVDTASAKGTVEMPAWPQTGVTQPVLNHLGARREAARTEEYKATLKDIKSGKLYEITKIGTKDLDAATFGKLRPGTKWTAGVSGLGSIKELAPVVP
ncbi:MAG TPA: zinc finger Ran-binding domain-containing protein [Candidatus Ozemobacteraceae bacterium]|nr:zinc finger Ran-binding domain-containing protein [Candidatus Ozemobacteraceae bacterium]